MAYIDRDLLLKDIEESVVFTVRGQNSLEIKGANKITDRIKQMPTADVVEVVRCKDCIHRTKDDFCFKVASDVVPKKVKGDFFCSYGKRG